MSVDCAGNHCCEPQQMPTELDERWQCPECDMRYSAFDVHEAHFTKRLSERVRSAIPVGTLGWRSL